MPRKDLDTLLGLLGSPGRYQILLYFLLSFQLIPLSLNNLSTIFTAGKPKSVHCRNLHLNESSALDVSCSTSLDFSDGNMIQTCSKYGATDANSTSNSTLCSVCDPEFNYGSESETTLVGEFGMICEDYWMVSLSPTLFFLGAMLGGSAFGILADKYGRKNALLLSCGFSFAVGFGVTFAPNFATYAIFRFFLGFGLQGASLTAFTLTMEYFSKEYREAARVGSQLIWTVGIMMLAGFAYLIPNWRYLQLACVLVMGISFVYLFTLRESLRWLFTTRRFQEAGQTVNEILRFNNIPRTREISNCVDYLNLWYQKESEMEEEEQYPVWNLFTSKQLRKRVLGMTFVWFTASVWYYVLAFAITDLFGSPHVNLVVGGAVDFVITIATMFIAKRFGCRLPLVYCCTIGAILSIIAGVIPQTSDAAKIAKTVFALLATRTTHSMFNLMMPFASDLLPTAVRNNGLGICSFGLRFGGVVAPIMGLLGTYTLKEVPFVVCGVMGLLAALITYLLPETKGSTLPETVEDLELTESFLRSSPVPPKSPL